MSYQVDCAAVIDSTTYLGVGQAVIVFSAEGTLGGDYFTGTPATVTFSGTGSWAVPFVVTSTTGNILFRGTGGLAIVPSGKSFVKWSKIGKADFTIDESNEAGERPMDWNGSVWDVRKLGNKVVAYGENGVSLLIPNGVVIGLQTIHRIGLKGKRAVAGTDSMHFFVDNLGQLWKLTDGLKMLDYSEFLASTTTDLSLFYDKAGDILYLCDGVKGFIYCDGSESFGKGPINVSGIDSKSGSLYVTAPAAISTPVFEICTDIYDFGTRKGKSIVSIEFGTDVVTPLKVSIDYRYDKAKAFNQTPWYTVDPRGIYYISIYGKEFRFRLKTEVYEYFELDYINVNYRVHEH